MRDVNSNGNGANRIVWWVAATLAGLYLLFQGWMANELVGLKMEVVKITQQFADIKK